MSYNKRKKELEEQGYTLNSYNPEAGEDEEEKKLKEITKKAKKKNHYTKKANGKNATGRKTIDRTQAVEKLAQAFSKGCTVVEACLYANINRNVYYEIVKSNDNISEYFDSLKQKPGLKARFNIVESIEEGDLDTSKWYAERKLKDEFSTKTTTDITVTNAEEELQDRKSKLEAFLNDLG